ncbi:hypothetical protein SAMN05660350_04954 [Geodermatophilus obscurus]|uniref:Uncharacterized protein n=1 Tax=Geodermatophilus obscurus TaxID=1861 RepID=A0A1M7V195_9ACTN|nr:hypothetical protein [Geodermatophilus obscurus]SHN88962.1 hypothetical protein SAMN05660350_04954 [Geodermatophilus obscurus]
MGRSRVADPDGYVVDADRGSSAAVLTKRAQLIDAAAAAARADTRDGARELDAAVEALPGLTRARRDRERAMPRATTADVPHPAMRRRLPGADAVRGPLSSRQRKARSVIKRAAQDRLPTAQHTAVHQLISRSGRWRELNDALSDAAGDVQTLDEDQRRTIQRVDRAVQTFERANDRGHVVYSNVQMPAAVNRFNLAGFVRNNFWPGTVIHFDRFTAAAHTLHEVEPGPEGAERCAVFEVQTRRGAYLGASDGWDDTAHLLPRGMRLAVAGTHRATYRRPDGSLGSRQVIQLVDLDDTQPPS